MPLIFSWELELIIANILTSAPWIFRDVLLILWARSTKKREVRPKYTKLLLVIGIFLLSWNIMYVFLPTVNIGFSSLPDKSDFLMFTTINCLYAIIPSLLHAIYAVLLVLFFHNISYHHNKKSLIGPAIFLLGNIIFLCILTFVCSTLFSIDWFDIALLETLEMIIELEAIAYIIPNIIMVLGFCFVFLYSIYKNNALLIMSFGLYFAGLLFSLFRGINYALIEFYPW